jgi:hypothetical protein
MTETFTEPELRAAWNRLRMAGDFDASMRRTAVRRAIECAARAMRARELRRITPTTDLKRRSAND